MNKCSKYFEILKENPNDFSSLFNVGFCLLEEEDFRTDEAIDYFLKALDVSTGVEKKYLAEVYFCLYTSYKKKNDKETSKRHLDKAIELESKIENRIPMANRNNYWL